MSQEDLYKRDCIRTFSGKYMNVFEPTEDIICIEDIAYALTHQCRYAGHTQRFYLLLHIHSMSYLLLQKNTKRN